MIMALSLKDKLKEKTQAKKGKPLEVKPEIKDMSPVLPVMPDDLSARTDFRDLPEPQRTLGRIKYLLRHPGLSPTFRSAAALLICEFYGNDRHFIEHVNISALFPPPEYTQRTRIEMMKALEENSLIERRVVVRQGQDIRLLF